MLPDQYKFQGTIGTQRSFNHEECGDKRERLYVKRVNSGWVYHCHNCYDPGDRSTHGFCRDVDALPPSVTLEAWRNLKENQVLAERKMCLPYDFTPDIPARGLTWLYDYGVEDHEIDEFGFGYSPSLKRLIMPVWDDDGSLLYWQGRTLDRDKEFSKDHPKYINVRAAGKDVHFKRETGKVCGTVVLVEDILSAIRVGRQVDCIALLGSYIPDTISKEIKDYAQVLIWLDPDKLKESVKYTSKLAVLSGTQIKSVMSKCDPKEYSDYKIYEYISGRVVNV